MLNVAVVTELYWNGQAANHTEEVTFHIKKNAKIGSITALLVCSQN